MKILKLIAQILGELGLIVLGIFAAMLLFTTVILLWGG